MLTVIRTSIASMAVAALWVSSPLAAEDWNQFRGPNRDNISSETGLMEKWPEGGPELAWRAAGLGAGYSSVAVVGDSVYSMGNADGGEYIVAIQRGTGEEIWRTKNGEEYHDGTGDGPRGTPTIVDGKVYALGGNGDLTCCDAATGDVFWQKNILTEFGGSNITWGISESVLIDDGNVICTPGGNKGTVVALNAETGNTQWAANVPERPKAAYASPVVATIGRIKQYVVFTSMGVAGFRASDGRPMWGQNKSSNGTANCATPLVVGKYVFSSSDYGTGAELIELSNRQDTTSAQSVYHSMDMKNHHGGMVHIDGYVYGSNSDILACVKLKTGKPAWRERSMKGSVIAVNDRIIFRHEDGPVVLLAASPKAYEELGRFDQPDRSSRPAWAHPVVAHGQLYLRDQDQLLVYNLSAQTTAGIDEP